MIISQDGGDDDDDNAVPISPPFWCSISKSYALRIEYRSEEYILKWKKSSHEPNLSQFPQLKEDVICERVTHSKEEATIWASSHLRAFGSHAHVRKSVESAASEGSFPMYKIAHRAEASQRFIRNEFGMLQELQSSGVPVVKIGKVPLTDEHGIFGFTMEELYPIKPKDIPLYYQDIEDALDELHKLDYIITDVTVSNVMLTGRRQVRLIDFGQAGKLGEPLPDYHPFRRHGKQKFELEMDIAGLEGIKQRIGLTLSCS